MYVSPELDLDRSGTKDEVMVVTDSFDRDRTTIDRKHAWG
jgi:hypothetical protein